MANTNQSIADEYNGVSQVVTVTLSSAQIIAMYATPILLVPGISNKAIIVESVDYIMTRTATAFTGGGTFNVQYNSTANGAGTATTAVNAATVITGAAGVVVSRRIPVDLSAIAIASIQGIGLYLSNLTAAFATGTGSLQVRISYHTA